MVVDVSGALLKQLHLPNAKPLTCMLPTRLVCHTPPSRHTARRNRAQVHCSHISVSMSAAEADKAFPEAAFRSHRRIADTRNGQKRGGSSAVLRATGDILIPQSVSEHVEFISGLTELWVTDGAGGGMGKLNGAGAGRVGSVGDAGVSKWVLVCIGRHVEDWGSGRMNDKYCGGKF